MKTSKVLPITISSKNGKWVARISDQTRAEVRGAGRYYPVTAESPEAAYWRLKYNIEVVDNVFSPLLGDQQARKSADKHLRIIKLEKELKYWKNLSKFFITLLGGTALLSLIL